MYDLCPKESEDCLKFCIVSQATPFHREKSFAKGVACENKFCTIPNIDTCSYFTVKWNKIIQNLCSYITIIINSLLIQNYSDYCISILLYACFIWWVAPQFEFSADTFPNQLRSRSKANSKTDGYSYHSSSHVVFVASIIATWDGKAAKKTVAIPPVEGVTWVGSWTVAGNV